MSGVTKLDPALAASQHPEHDKLSLVSESSQAIGEFLEWLPTVGVHLATIDRESWTDDRLVPDGTSIQDLLAAYFEIDRAALDAEKRAMLAALGALTHD